MNKFLTEILPRGYRSAKLAVNAAYERARIAAEQIENQGHNCDCEFCEYSLADLNRFELDELEAQCNDAKAEAVELEKGLRRMELYAKYHGVEL